MNKTDFTFAQLKMRVGSTKNIPTPSASALLAGGVCVAEQEMTDGSHLWAFENGFALFQTIRRSTVLRIDACGGYAYYTRIEEHYFEESYFYDKPWYIRLQLEAEDRLLHNQNARESEPNIETRLAGNVAAFTPDALDALILKEELTEIMTLLTEKQRKAVMLNFFFGYTQVEVAKAMCVSQAMVAGYIKQAKKKLNKIFKFF